MAEQKGRTKMGEEKAGGAARGWTEEEPRCEKHPSRYLFQEDCGQCGGEGQTEPGELFEQDPLWYDEDDVEACHACMGRGWFRECQACIDGLPAEEEASTASAPKEPSKAVESGAALAPAQREGE